MVRALTQASAHLPAEARAELVEQRSHQRRRAARTATFGLCALYLLIPLLLWNGVRDRRAMIAMAAMLGVSTVVALSISRARRIPTWYYIGLMLVLGGFVATSSTIFGPFFVSPALGLACAAALIAGARLDMRWRAAVIAIAIAAVLVPALLEWATSSWSYRVTDDGVLGVLPTAIEFSRDRILVLLASTAVATILLPSMVIGRSVDVLHRAEERLFAQAWRLRKIFPDRVDESLPRPPA